MIWLAILCLFIVFFFLMGFLIQKVLQSFKTYRSYFDHSVQLGLQDYFMFLDTRLLWILSFVSSVMIGLLCHLIVPWIFGVLIGLVWLLLPFVVLNYFKKKRIYLFDQMLPDFLLTFASTLQSGMSIQFAIKQLSMNSAYPLNIELGLMLNEQRLGVSFEESLDHLYDRVSTDACCLFVSAIKIAYKTGGQLSETLYKMSSLLMKIQQIQGKINALSAQGKIQAWVMGLLPLFCLGALQVVDPSASHLFFYTTIGAVVLGGVFVWECIGIWFILKMVKIEV